MSQLGEVFIPGQSSDVSYTGETGAGFLGIQYMRDKVREFQGVLNAVDNAAGSLVDAVAEVEAYKADVESAGQDTSDLQELLDGMYSDLASYESKKTAFRVTGEAINLGASGINALGGRFPELSIPTGLGLPIVIPVALVAAVGVAAGLILWGNTWLQGISDRMKIATQAGLISDPAARDAFVAKIGLIDAQAAAASGSGLSNIAGIVKWGAIAAGIWFAYQAFMSTQHRN